VPRIAEGEASRHTHDDKREDAMPLLEKRHALVAAARAVAVSKGDLNGARAFLAAAFGTHNEGSEFLARALVDTSALQPGDAQLADLGAFIVSQIARLSIVGKLNAVSPFYRVPPAAPVLAETASAVGTWTPEGQKIRTSGQAFETFRLQVLKVAALCVYSAEFLRSVHPNVDAAITRDITNALARGVDVAFCDPANSGVAGVMPASPFEGNEIEGTGNVAADLATLLADYPEGALADAVLVVNPADIAQLIAAGYGRDGALTARDGGWLAGLPAVTSAAVPRGAIGILAPSQIAYTEAGAFVEASSAAVVEIEDFDTGELQLVSLWQQNCASLRGILYSNWETLTPGTARMVTDAIPQA
jgi:HK97 family phage major capsid protein